MCNNLFNDFVNFFRAQFSCAAVDCPEEENIPPGCYTRQSALDCCSNGVICRKYFVS